MTVDLSDEGLGPLTLQAAAGAGGLHLRLAAGDRAVGDALAGAAEQLRRDLEASGTTLASFDVGHRSDTSGRQPFAPPTTPVTPAGGSTAAVTGRALPTVSTAPRTAGVAATGVDLLI
ncbi:unannotated protein [freshwater metagenome]|uniref:Unannotated protein n=1 Tax=freshwater metagenome TaxID=449393 RepID=A0A6J6GHP3_9ZZZZ